MALTYVDAHDSGRIHFLMEHPDSPRGHMTGRYEEKRDFRKTPEPKAGGKTAAKEGRLPRFVVQEHRATSHHFDFRLEIGGALVSWAVPKGPSTDPSEKRLAIRTEDHPLDYAEFEGVIPEGQYGAGTVLIWDRGCFENITEQDEDAGAQKALPAALEEGHLLVRLKGEKLQGGYALQRIEEAERQGDQEQWLLIKMKDKEADARRNPVSTEPRSVASGRTLGEVSKEETQEGKS